MTKQKLLALSFKPEYAEEDFCISGCNMEAFRIIKRWPNWPGHSIIIYGPAGSGKTHLAKIWQQKTKALPVKGMNIFSSPTQCILPPVSDCLRRTSQPHLCRTGNYCSRSVAIKNISHGYS